MYFEKRFSLDCPHSWQDAYRRRRRAPYDEGFSLAPLPQDLRHAWAIMKRVQGKKEDTYSLVDTLHQLETHHDLAKPFTLF